MAALPPGTARPEVRESMILARVIGTVVATRKEERLVGAKLLIVQPVATLDPGRDDGKPLVAIDAVGAGPGEIVMVCSGSSARQTARTKDSPVDAVIMAIVDALEVGGTTVFSKG